MSKRVEIEPETAPAVVLVRPQMAENVGMVARAMMNCALTELRLVCPREEPTNPKAIAASSGAQVILENARVYDTLAAALADRQFVLATTARPRDMTKPVYHPEKGMALCLEKMKMGAKIALMFGAERTGLENPELIMADALVEIPLNPHHCSLNLSQAVLLMGYTWFRLTRDYDNSHLATGGSLPATKEELAVFLDHLEKVLDEHGYFRFPAKRTRMQRNLRNIFTRAGLTHAEIKTLHGVITDLTKPK